MSQEVPQYLTTYPHSLWLTSTHFPQVPLIPRYPSSVSLKCRFQEDRESILQSLSSAYHILHVADTPPLFVKWMNGQHLIYLAYGHCSISASYILVFIVPIITDKKEIWKEKGKGTIGSDRGCLPPSLPPTHCENDVIVTIIVLLLQPWSRWATLKEIPKLKPSWVSRYSSLAGYWLNNMLACRQIVKLKIIQRVPLHYPSHLISKEGILQLATQKLFYILVTMHKN